jgi:hypothetical protein
MALEEYLGAIVMEIDGQEVELESVDTSERNLRKLVKTMNRTGRAKGFAKLIPEYTLDVTAAIPLTGEINWAAIQGAQIVIYPVEATGKRIRYQDCFTVDVGESYMVDGESKRKISMAALRKVED